MNYLELDMADGSTRRVATVDENYPVGQAGIGAHQAMEMTRTLAAMSAGEVITYANEYTGDPDVELTLVNRPVYLNASQIVQARTYYNA